MMNKTLENTAFLVDLRRAFTIRAAGFRRLLLGIGLAAAACGCAPMAAAPPMATMQRGAALPDGARAFAIGAGAGVGGVKWAEGAAGFAMQHRVSEGGGNELQISGQAVGYHCSGCVERLRGTHVSVGGRVGWRGQLGAHTAWLGGLGASGGAGSTAVGGDVGLVTDVFSKGYVSGRLGVAQPLSPRDVYNRTDRDNDGTEETHLDPTTGYGVLAAGVRLGRETGFLAEVGISYIQAGAEHGAAVYGLLGVDVLKLTGN